MAARTVYIIPKDDKWAVMKEVGAEGLAKPYSRLFSTQKKAIDAAREIVERLSAGQIVVFGRDGSIRRRNVHGLPVVQKSPSKSALGTKAIERAVSTVIRKRLLGN